MTHPRGRWTYGVVVLALLIGVLLLASYGRRHVVEAKLALTTLRLLARAGAAEAIRSDGLLTPERLDVDLPTAIAHPASLLASLPATRLR